VLYGEFTKTALKASGQENFASGLNVKVGHLQATNKAVVSVRV